MALRGFVLMLFLGCLDLTIATYCSYSSNCDVHQTCCRDGVCRSNCYSCSYDHECGTGEECCDIDSRCKTTCTCSRSYQCGDGKECCSGHCKSSCTDVGIVVGILVGNILFFGGIIAIAANCCCRSAPCYRRRHDGRVVAVAQVVAQPVQTTTITRHISQVQHPTKVVNNPTLPVGFHQPPPPYTTVAYQSKSPPSMTTAVVDN